MSIGSGSGRRARARRTLVGSRRAYEAHVVRSQGMGRAGGAQGAGPRVVFPEKHREARAGASITTFEFRYAIRSSPLAVVQYARPETSGTTRSLPCSDSRPPRDFRGERRNFAGRAPTRLALSLRVVPPRTMRPKEGTAPQRSLRSTGRVQGRSPSLQSDSPRSAFWRDSRTISPPIASLRHASRARYTAPGKAVRD